MAVYTPFTAATYREVKDNPSSANGSENAGAEQEQVEEAQYEGGIPVRMNQVVRVVLKQRGATAKVNFQAGTMNSNAGVVMPDSDEPGRFLENTIGKS